MIGTKRTEKKDWALEDNSKDLVNACGQETLDAVRAAMKAGLMEFTTPTPEDNQERIDWKVRRWVFLRVGKPCCVLVAQKVSFEHFEVVGPEIPLESGVK